MPTSEAATTVTVLRELSETADLRTEWNRLVEVLDQPEVFYTYEWARAVESAFCRTMQPFIVLQREEERLVGVAAMGILKDDPARAVFLGSTTADYCDFLSKAEDRFALIRATFAALLDSGVTEVELGQVPTGSATLEAVQGLPLPWRLRMQPGESCLLVDFSAPTARETVTREVSKKQAEKRHWKTLSHVGTIGIRDVGPSDNAETEIAALVRSHIGRFLLTDRESPYLQVERVDFLKSLCRRMADAGWLKLTALTLNEKSIAWNYGFNFGGKWFWYVPTFDVQYDPYGPGTLLLRHLILSGTASPDVRVVDLGLGAEFYKTRFANATQGTTLVRLTSSLKSHRLGTVRDLAVRYLRTKSGLNVWIRKQSALIRRAKTKFRENGMTVVATLIRRGVGLAYENTHVLFFSPGGTCAGEQRPDLVLREIDWDLIAECAIQNREDPGTLNYLKHSARRLSAGGAQGYSLASTLGEVLSLGWVAERQGFHVEELGIQLEGPGLVIFDCITPGRHRGRNYYSELLRRLVQKFAASESELTIFCTDRNLASIKGIEKAGFLRRREMERRKVLGRYW